MPAASSSNLLAVAGYAGADMGRKMIALQRMIGERHGPVVHRDGAHAVCPSCRTTGGRQHRFPCPTWVDNALIMGAKYPAEMFEKFGVRVPSALVEETPAISRTLVGAPPPTHPYAGSNKARQEVGDPGHCEKCAQIGHVRAHPTKGCGDVGCTVGHSPEDPADQAPVD